MIRMLEQKILNKEAKIGIIGLGYVGLPLALTFVDSGFRVCGIDVDSDRVRRLKKGISYIIDVTSDEIKKALSGGRFVVTDDFSHIKNMDAFIICVPTPLGKTKEPDVSYMVAAAEDIKKHMRKGQVVVLESTTYPGTTEELLLPILESTGLKEGKDFYLAFSPERVDPGNKRYHTKNTPKITGGISKDSGYIAKILYEQAIDTVITVSSSKVAEMAKLLENTFRIVNIGLVNEIMLMCDKLGVDVWEVIEAAKTKPYGFMPFYPGPGVGGHCLSKDEYVHVKDSGKDELKTVKISDFVKECAADKRSLRHSLSGSTFIKPFNKEVLTYDPSKEGACFKDVGVVSEREYSDEMIDVRTSDSRRFSITPKHPVMVVSEGILGVKFADELQIGDEIPIVMTLPELARSKSDHADDYANVDIIDFLELKKLTSNVRVKSACFDWGDYKDYLARYAGVNKSLLRDYLRDGSLPLDIYLKIEKMADWSIDRKDLILATGRGVSFQGVPAIFNIDENFVRFIGYYLSEGCITVDKSIRTRLTFNSSETQYINDIEIFLRERGIKYSLYRSRVWKSVCIKISSDIFGYLIRDILKCGTNSYTMKIPDRFMVLPKRLKLNLLMGILRGDGGVDCINGKRAYIKNGRRYLHNDNSAVLNYFTSSDVLFNQMVMLLQDFGVVPAFKKRRHFMNISGYRQIERFKGIFLGDKALRIRSYLTGCRKIIPNKNFKFYKNLAAVKIKEISHSLAEKVYSMEVKGTNTFVTSYGFLTHNCIPLDPIYLSWKAKMHGFEARFIDLASRVNSEMPDCVIRKVARTLNGSGKAVKGSKVLVIGVAYKKDVKDLRESPALEIIERLDEAGADVSYHDPYFPYLKIHKINLKNSKLNKDVLGRSDCVVIVTDHSNIDYKFIVKNTGLIVDTRNALKGMTGKARIAKL